MKKIIIAMALVMSLLTLSAFAATTNQQNTADALNSMGLFKGTGNGYELDKQLMRSDGITLLVRLIGKEAESKNDKYTHPFNDVADWLKPYVSYAYSTGMTKGVEDGSRYGSNMDMSKAQFLTMVLRTLGYSDGANGDFTWDKPYELAKEVGLVSTTAAGTTFTRGEAVEIFWKALDATSKGTSVKFVKTLIADGAFTQSAYDAAAKIQKNGKTPVSGGSTGGSSQPSTGGGSTTGGSTTGGSTGGAATSGPAAGITYEDYMNMSGEDQMALSDKFPSVKDFVEWLSGVKEVYDEEQKKNEIIIDGEIDLEQIINGTK